MFKQPNLLSRQFYCCPTVGGLVGFCTFLMKCAQILVGGSQLSINCRPNPAIRDSRVPTYLFFAGYLKPTILAYFKSQTFYSYVFFLLLTCASAWFGNFIKSLNCKQRAFVTVVLETVDLLTPEEEIYTFINLLNIYK